MGVAYVRLPTTALAPPLCRAPEGVDFHKREISHT